MEGGSREINWGLVLGVLMGRGATVAGAISRRENFDVPNLLETNG